MAKKCQYCASPAVMSVEPFPGAGYQQDLCQHHYHKGLDMAADRAMEDYS